MLKKVINSFYLRNFIILCLFISPDILQKLTMEGDNRLQNVAVTAYNLSCFYSYIVFHNSVLYERILKKKKYLLYIVVFISTLVFWRELTHYITWLFTRSATDTHYMIRELKQHNFAFWVFIYWANVVYIYIGLGVYLSFRYFKEREEALNLLYLKKQLELKQLQQQLNPHFLFNALNNIYSYSITHNNEHTNELIMKLSELMRFIITNTDTNKIPLNEEVNFIQHYIAFEQERLGNRCTVTFEQELSSDIEQITVAPFLLFIFVENAFKHGTNFIDASYVYIRIVADKKRLYFEVRNSVKHSKTKSPSENVGLENVKRRLALLYPKQHKLTIIPAEQDFKVMLNVNLIRDGKLYDNR